VTVAETWRSVSGTLPVVIEAPSSQDIWSAALLKGQFPLSYADALAAALAQKHNCPVVTGDPEFRSVKDLKIEWVGNN
jgi:predicted nucleic acid-binding protein